MTNDQRTEDRVRRIENRQRLLLGVLGVALHGPESKGGTVLYHKGKGTLTHYDEEGSATVRWPE